MNQKKTNFIVLFVYLVVIFLSFYVTNISASFDYLDSSNSFILEGNDFTPDFSSHSVEYSGELLTYTTQIPKIVFTSLENTNGDFYTLFIHKLADNAISVYFNNQLIGTRGDLENAHSNLWNDFTAFQIPKSLIKTNNNLTFKTATIYRSGISAYPLQITTDSVSPQVTRDLVILTNRSINIAIGFVLATVAISMLLMMLTKDDKRVFIYTAFSSVFFALYCYDYLSIDYLPIDYLIYKKLTMTGLFFGIAFYSYAISEYYSHKPLKWLANIVFVCFTFIMIISNDMTTFKNIYTYAYILLVVNILYWILLTIIKYKTKRSIVFFTGFTMLLAYAGTITLMDILGKHSTINTPLIYIAIIGVMPLLLAYESYIKKDTEIDIESGKRKEAFINSVTDSLTGAWNQRYLYSISDKTLVGSVVSVIDFDDFKKINDTYGHVSGDKVIVETCNIIKSKTREADDLIRYGGDEFIVIMYNCSLDEANERVSAILNSVDRTSLHIDGNKLKITLSIGLYNVVEPLSIKEVIERADFQLYRAKLNGKNQISF